MRQDIGWFDEHPPGELPSAVTAAMAKIEDGIGRKVTPHSCCPIGPSVLHARWCKGLLYFYTGMHSLLSGRVSCIVDYPRVLRLVMQPNERMFFSMAWSGYLTSFAGRLVSTCLPIAVSSRVRFGALQLLENNASSGG